MSKSSESTPLVSVVIPVYNRGEALAETLDSALAQTWGRLEIIVVDDGSVDTSPDVCRRYGDRIRYLRRPHLGAGAARNAGIEAASGEYIALLDHDDLWLPDKLLRQIEIAGEHPDSGMIVCNGEPLDAPPGIEPWLLSARLGHLSFEGGAPGVITRNFYVRLLTANFISCPALTLIPRRVLEEVGPLSTRGDESTDTELYLRIALEYPFTVHNDSLVRKRYVEGARSGPTHLRPIVGALRNLTTYHRHVPVCPQQHLPVLLRSIRSRVRLICERTENASLPIAPSEREEILASLKRMLPTHPRVRRFERTLARITQRTPASLVAEGTAIRRIVIEQCHRAGVGHIGSALSIADIVGVLYGRIVKAESPQHPERDRVILSKGHAAIALYAALFRRGWMSREELDRYCAPEQALAVHPDHRTPGIEFSTGSLGHGLSIGAGAALAARMQGSPRRVFVILSDAECNTGSTWEAAMFAGQHRLSNLVAIVDVNGSQALGRTSEIIDLEPLGEKWRAFRWDVRETDGHDGAALADALTAMSDFEDRPRVVLARTIMGKGVSFMEHDYRWHYLPLTPERCAQALAELGAG
jgi:transketolase